MKKGGKAEIMEYRGVEGKHTYTNEKKKRKLAIINETRRERGKAVSKN